MTAPIYMHRREIFGHICLAPANQQAVEVVGKIPRNHVVQVEIKRPRNIRHHRLFWALMTKVFENQERYDSLDHMVTALKVALGHCDTVICKDGKVAYFPKSISFAKMDQTAFDIFFGQAVDMICQRFLPGCDKDELTREVHNMVGSK